ncbi:MAG: SDR family NAD(P)-dependent oxidoreductase, partial [Acidobacteria bacterium]|nr:SDR family NAD(P)-dependent oxidoreductase [Acidobacteriota bacterium]
MLQSIEGRIAIVTGGTRGIGRAVAERLAREGGRVALCGRSQDGVRQAIEEMPNGVFGMAADVSRLDQVRKFFNAVDERFGGL